MRLAGNKQTSKIHVIKSLAQDQHGKVLMPFARKCHSWSRLLTHWLVGVSCSFRVMRLGLKQDMASYKINGVINRLSKATKSFCSPGFHLVRRELICAGCSTEQSSS